jgi:hypothetical protein
MSYNNLTFAVAAAEVLPEVNVRATVKLSVMILTAGAGWALRKCPCTTALGVPGGKVSEHRERSVAFQPARTIRLRRQRSLGHFLFTVFPGWWTQRPGSSESSS